MVPLGRLLDSLIETNVRLRSKLHAGPFHRRHITRGQSLPWFQGNAHFQPGRVEIPDSTSEIPNANGFGRACVVGPLMDAAEKDGPESVGEILTTEV